VEAHAIPRALQGPLVLARAEQELGRLGALRQAGSPLRDRGSEGFSVTLKKVEFGPKHTRVCLTARNDSEKAAKFDFYGSKLIQDGKRVGQNDPFDYHLPKPKPGLQPGEETEGAVIFGHADPSQPLQVSFAWEHGGFMAGRCEPLVLEVAPQG
jgi:hypothetical protein